MARSPRETPLPLSAVRSGACYENPNSGHLLKVLEKARGRVWYIERGRHPGPPGRWHLQSTHGTAIDTFRRKGLRPIKRCPPDAAAAAGDCRDTGCRRCANPLARLGLPLPEIPLQFQSAR
jgi:hypothetical protein